jgi:hypothetical protein
MNLRHRDVLPLAASGLPSRRNLLRGLAGVGLGLGTAGRADSSETKKRRGRRNQPAIKRNGFGCVNVGKDCRRDGQCCSGICEGSAGRKRCRAHDASICRAGQAVSSCDGTNVACTTGANQPGTCATTTGNAGYCAGFVDCFSCRIDADCVPACGPRAACIRCAAACGGTGGTACASLTTEGCDFEQPEPGAEPPFGGMPGAG